MNLVRLYAYLVEPQRKADSDSGLPPTGGHVPVNHEITTAIRSAVSEAQFPQRTEVNFYVDTTTRTNKTRDCIIALAFGDGVQAGDAAFCLAANLSHAMDRRSSPCLFIPAVFDNKGQKDVTLWTFPRDNAFQFSYDQNGARVQNLTDVFSQTSKLRKAALFNGTDPDNRNDFLEGRVFDSQSRSTVRDVADFWVVRFLECRSAVGPDAGTKMLAECIRTAHEKCVNAASREQLSTATMAIKNGPPRRLSMNDFAGNYLTGEARERFLRAVKDRGHLEFEFQSEVFETVLKFQIYELETGVFVSSPFGQIGSSVQIQSDESGKTLRCEGRICGEKMRLRYAG